MKTKKIYEYCPRNYILYRNNEFRKFNKPRFLFSTLPEKQAFVNKYSNKYQDRDQASNDLWLDLLAENFVNSLKAGLRTRCRQVLEPIQDHPLVQEYFNPNTSIAPECLIKKVNKLERKIAILSLELSNIQKELNTLK